ncbi:MAG: tyrosine-protein phosphatase [Candidatus Azobacteroides sp.]|nr:tyrosine-protein phosphatase [Candidatus Azobacteroides sp.]
MFKNIVFSLASLSLFVHCTSESPQINAVCELTSNGTYIVKWETFPPMEGKVRIYESSQPDSFNMNVPVFEEDIQTGYKQILSSPISMHPYFKLVFNKQYSIVTSLRVIPMQGIFNFRDLGGYFTHSNKQIKWGKVYRSGSLTMATKRDMETLYKMGIETVIDLRTEKESFSFPNKFKAPRVYNLPLRGNRHDIFFDEILSRKMNLPEVLVYNHEVFSFLLENNSDYFIKLFDVLLDEKNYPIVIFCSLGKDRTAIAAALLLAALDVDEDVIMEDYLNNSINYKSLVQNADIYPEEVQKTITALYSSHKETLNYSFERVKSNYGSLDNYFEKELNLTHRKREKLKSLLLYP